MKIVERKISLPKMSYLSIKVHSRQTRLAKHLNIKLAMKKKLATKRKQSRQKMSTHHLSQVFTDNSVFTGNNLQLYTDL